VIFLIFRNNLNGLWDFYHGTYYQGRCWLTEGTPKRASLKKAKVPMWGAFLPWPGIAGDFGVLEENVRKVGG
jgi:hypothetical protein